MLRVVDCPAEVSDRLLECPRILKPGFVDRIEVEPSITLGAKPLLERFRGSHLERTWQVVFDVFNADEERTVPLRFNVGRPGLHLKCFPGARLRYDDRAVSLVDLLPSRGVAEPKDCLNLVFVGVA